MSNYVESDYVENGYVEGDESLPSETPTAECDLTSVVDEIALLKAQNQAILSKLDEVFTKVNSNNTLSLSINDKVVDVRNKVTVIDTTYADFVTKDFFMANMPHANDKLLDVYPNGTQVKVRYLPSIYTVHNSFFVPISGNYHTFSLVYTLSKEIDGEMHYSNYSSIDVLDVNPELYVLAEVEP